jgi:hypothetical protein
MFVAQFSAPATLTATFAGLNGSSAQTLVGGVASIMSNSCTFDSLYVAATITANVGADTLTYTLTKNGSPTSLSTTISVSTLNLTVISSDTTGAHAFSVVAGDAVAIQLVHANGSPTIRMSITSHCQ